MQTLAMILCILTGIVLAFVAVVTLTPIALIASLIAASIITVHCLRNPEP
jgi:hypothetical protein